eukprot:924230-Prorocentrum_minimum.AAC.2
MNLAEGDPRIAAMAAGVGGAVPGLIQLLETGTPAGQEQAAGALRTLSIINKGINVAIAREGAFEPLVKLLGYGPRARVLTPKPQNQPGLGDERLVAAAPVSQCRRGRELSAQHSLSGFVPTHGICVYIRGSFPCDCLTILPVRPPDHSTGIGSRRSGTQKAREEAAGTLWRQLEMMRENAIEVNISTARVQNLVDMLRAGTEGGREAAAAVIHYCANSERNRANIMRGKAVCVLVDLLQTEPPRVRLQVRTPRFRSK